MDWTDYDAALFDLDGVLTPTAEVHMRAWDQMFNDFLTARGITEPYTTDDYYRYVDGKPRYDGVRAFLVSRGIELVEGSSADSPDIDSVRGLGNRKNDAFSAVLDADGVRAYPGSLRLLDALGELDLPLAVVSSSRNAEDVLAAAGLRDRFATVVDGRAAEDENVPGKPRPDTFWLAARRLGVEPGDAVVVEDAVSGIEAGRAGGFGLVVGVDRGAGEQTLRDAGADVVVADLEEL